jgi:hypothetical protein
MRSYEKFRDQGNFLQISGLNVEGINGGLRIHIGTKGHLCLLDPMQIYTVATTSYLATSKEAYRDLFEPFDPPDVIESSVREAVETELLAQGSTCDFSNTARWN